ncbi:hypothetical protein C2S51_014302 [Perilla frutescens var. frutescens]|nr:hypothetical protein C2S51_014302 [Perilla frutescens var. frutescens]
MEINKGKIWKTWKSSSGKKQQQWQQKRKSGCLSIYVGEERERFVIKTEYVNHPLFKALLEEAESEYGYSCEGPLLLPCNVDHFLHLLAEINKPSCTSYHLLLTPPRFRLMLA